jgi:septal ring factor EnvC (AmiA/AmiB activator)
MNALDFDQAADETFRESDVSTRQPVPERDEVVAALNLVSETATAIKAFEEQAAQALMRAQEVADAVREDLSRAELRAERAETMLRLTEDQVEQMSATIEQAHQEIEALQSQLDSKAAELAASERRADDAEDAIEQIMDVIRARTIPPN